MEQTFQPGPLADVSCETDADRWTLIFVRELRHPPMKVWRALTEPEQLARWSPFIADRDLAHVGPAILTMIDDEHSVQLPPATITVAKPPTLLEYTWGPDVLRWELLALIGSAEGRAALTGSGEGEPAAAGTRLTLRHTMSEPGQVPMVAAGWHLCLVVAEHLLDGAPIPPIRGEKARAYGWDELHEQYRQRLA